MDDLLRILAVLALVGGNAFFVIGEYSIVTARRTAVQARAAAGSSGARTALRLMDEPVRVISTVQVGITALGILTGAVGEPMVRDLLGSGIPHWLGFILGFAIVTYLSVVLGELVPKALTLDRADRLAVLVAPPVALMAKVLHPLVWVLQGSAALLLRPFGVRDVVAGEVVSTPEELQAIVDEAEGAGVIGEAQEEMLHNVFEFAHREARDVMVPAGDVAWLEAAMTIEAAVDDVLDRRHSRYPVGRGSLDHPIGVVHVRDLLAGLRGEPDAAVETLARPVPVVPETKDLGALLREMRERRQQLVIVADEYGGTIGIVTVEDILEELVGEIEDEYDLPDDSLVRVDEHTVRVAGSMTIDDFNEELGTELPQNGPHTMAGLVFHMLGRRPQPGESVEVDGVELTVEEVDGARIKRLLVKIGQPADESRPGG
jgi:putative hemolysin